MKATVSTVDSDGNWHIRCLLRDPVVLPNKEPVVLMHASFGSDSLVLR